MNILIIEDEQLAVKQLTKMIQLHMPESRFLANLSTVSRTIEWFQNNDQPDLIFLDIQLADGISFEIFEKVKVTAPIIFCTAYDQYAIRAFKLNSIDYILKPIDSHELGVALQKFKENKFAQPELTLQQIQNLLVKAPQSYKSRFVVKWGERILAIDINQILYFFSEDKLTLLMTQDGKKYVLDYRLEELEDLLNPVSFFRLNRKYICSISAIEAIHTYSNSRLKIVLGCCDDQDILVSREKIAAFKGWLGQ